MKRIAVITPGGDAPGMNAAIRAVTRCALRKKVEVLGVLRGWRGLINDEVIALSHRSVAGIINQGGTILKTARCPSFMTEEGQNRAWMTIKKYNLDGMIVIGGNGTFTSAYSFCQRYGFPCVGIAASIDNDINGIDMTIGVDTAVNTALSAIDNIRDTATSLERIYVVEVMGRDCGFIALTVALAGGCEEVIIPERPYNLEEICHRIVEDNLYGKESWIIVVAEGAAKAEDVAREIKELTTLDTRALVLGHIQRGGRPTAFSRELALRLGKCAVDYLLAGNTAKALGYREGKVVAVDFSVAIQKKEIKVDELYELIRTLT